MRTVALVPFLAVLVATGVRADIVRHATVPESLHGTWVLGTDDCAAPRKSAITLAAKSFAGADGSCTVEWVSETAAPRGPQYSARMHCGAPTEARPQATDLLILPRGDDTIAVGASFDRLETYRRCPAQ